MGVLLQTKNQGAITAVKPIIDRLIKDAEFRINSHLYQTFLQLAGEWMAIASPKLSRLILLST